MNGRRTKTGTQRTSDLVWIAAAIIGAIVAFFTVSNRKTAKAHARFQAKDVEEALAELVSPESEYHDAWDLFLSWPIDDPSLESIRQECLTIIRECDPPPPGKDLSDEGVERVAALLRELRSRAS
jgi:hypothetical protein